MSNFDDYAIDGIVYTKVPAPMMEFCNGCVGEYSQHLCDTLCNNCERSIWVVKDNKDTQDYIQKIQEKYPEEHKQNNVNPKHYDLFPEYGIQVREVMEVLCNKLDEQGYSGFLCSDYVQAMQYFLRWFEKNGVEDIEKGIWYMNKIIAQVSNKESL